MSADIQELIKRYQAGEEVRGEIETTLTAITDQVIKTVCGKEQAGFIDQDPAAHIEPFGLNDNDITAVFNKSLDYALETYKHDKNKKFTSWFYDVFYGRLYNLKGEYIKQQADGETLRNFKRYQERAKDILGSPVDENIIKQETSFNDKLLQGFSDQEKKYCALMLNCFMRNTKLTDETTGQVLGVSRRQVLRYKASLKSKLASMPGGWKWPEDELPDLEMFNRIKDPVPRQAARNIKDDVTLYCMMDEKEKQKGAKR